MAVKIMLIWMDSSVCDTLCSSNKYIDAATFLLDGYNIIQTDMIVLVMLVEAYACVCRIARTTCNYKISLNSMHEERLALSFL